MTLSKRSGDFWSAALSRIVGFSIPLGPMLDKFSWTWHGSAELMSPRLLQIHTRQLASMAGEKCGFASSST